MKTTIGRILIMCACGCIVAMIACVWLREPPVTEVAGVTRVCDTSVATELPAQCGDWAFGKNWHTERVSKLPDRWNARHASENGYVIRGADPRELSLGQIIAYWRIYKLNQLSQPGMIFERDIDNQGHLIAAYWINKTNEDLWLGYICLSPGSVYQLRPRT